MALPPHLAGLGAPPKAEPSPASAAARVSHGDVFDALLRWRAAGRRSALCTVVGVAGSSPRKLGAKMLVASDGEIVGTVGGGAIEHAVITDALAAIVSGTPREVEHHLTKDLGMCCGGSMRVFIDPQQMAPRLVVFGAGHIAAPLCEIASLLGWHVSVVDEREEWAAAERFPTAKVVRCASPLEILDEVVSSEDTFVVIVTHDHGLDFEILQALLPKHPSYLGVIGSFRKRERFRQRLRAAGQPEEAVLSFRSPMGLDIGAVTAEEIAVSIVSELVQVRRGAAASGTPLTEVDPRTPRPKVDGA